jgi:hypothetical protein
MMTPFFETNNRDLLAMFRKLFYPTMKKTENWIPFIYRLRGYQESHIDVITDVYIICVSSTGKTTLQGLVLVGPFLCLVARLTVDMQMIMLTMYF